MLIAVDFDGTLCEHEYPAIGEANWELINAIKQATRNNHKIILWTCRSGHYLEQAVAWCKEQGLEIASVNEDIESVKNSKFGKEKSCKVYADVYIDDRNMSISRFIEDSKFIENIME